MMKPAAASLPTSETLYPVQYLRAAAALVVFLFHISVLSQQVWALDPARVDQVGAAGVDLFFVISGFIMAMIVARPGAFDGKEFWIRRIARVVPAYWAVTIGVFALALFIPSIFSSTTADIGKLLTSLAFVPLDDGTGSLAPLLVVGWTLNYEMFFYAVVAVSAGLFGDRRLIGASALLLTLVAIGLVVDPGHPTVGFYTDPMLLEFVFGILIFNLWSRTKDQKSQAGSLAAFVSGVLLLIIQWETPVGEWRALFWGAPAALVLYGGLGCLSFRSQLLARLGDWSFALYLTHIFVVTFYIKHVVVRMTTVSLPWQAHYLIMTVIAVAVAAAFYRLVEQPFSALSLRLLRGTRIKAPASAQRLV